MDFLKKTFLFIVLTTLVPLYAQLSPGALNKAHADLEGVENCTQCHAVGQKLSADKCLACHQPIKMEREQHQGLHGQPAYAKCERCHIEHQGRTVDLIYWKEGRDNFNHAQTGFILKGAHQKLKCRQCHNSDYIQNPSLLTTNKKDLNRTFLGLQTNCLSCHIDEHRKQFSNRNCLDCHSMDGWKPAKKFNHRYTQFPLTGLHKIVTCDRCHRIAENKPIGKDRSYQVFKIKKSQKCIQCHQDAHSRKFGKKCSTCHTTQGWRKYKKSNFKHDLTDFPLSGKHRNVSCKTCHHSSETFKINKFRYCSDCHEDYHQGQFSESKDGVRCERCHTVQEFSPSNFTLKEHQAGRFPLTGAHKAVPCIACHKPFRLRNVQTLQFRFKTFTCETCHQDKHDGETKKWMAKAGVTQQKQNCTFCHSEISWQTVTFNHARTPFKLTGKHKQTACINCHKADGNGAVRFSGLKTNCASCHEDQHEGQFVSKNGNTSCERCHSTKNWLAEKFDHNRMSRFTLTGAHKKAACKACHHPQQIGKRQVVRFRPLATACESCHGEKVQ